MNFEIISYDTVDKNVWDQLVVNSAEGWLYQTSSWIDYAQNWGSRSLSFGIMSDRKELVALCPLYLDTNRIMGLIPNRRLYTGMSGPIFSPSLGLNVKKRLWRKVADYIDSIAMENRADVLQVRCTSIANCNLPPLRSEINPLWIVGISEPLYPIPVATLILNITKSEDQLLAEMDGDCRAAIRQAERAGVSFRIGNSLEDVELYEKIHRESWQRTGLTPNPLKYFTEMWDRFGKNDNAKFIFAEHAGKAIAGVLIHIFKQGVFYWGGCSIGEALRHRPNNYLLWSAITTAKQLGLSWFEVGQFQLHPGANPKEYNVGKYKAQFGKDYYIPFEGQKTYTSKAEIIKILKKVLKRNK